jgi:undecaprenyl phosphate-alpha-L-ara4N flippase subunit ArnE
MIVYVFLLVCILMMSIGQILLKKSAMLLPTLNHPFLLIFQPVFFGALCLYGVATVCWVGALQFLPLGRAYMFIALGFVIIPLLSWYFFGETLDIKFLVGAILIISGVLLTLK